MFEQEERLRKFAEDRWSTLEEQMQKSRTKKKQLYLQLLQKFVNFPYPSKNSNITETVDTKQENYQNQSVDMVEDKRNTISSISHQKSILKSVPKWK
ncbi:hypothetical protein TNIN_33951 [Trichonephila inaurata madagascariensis]|uniref:Uncharacterized protein n=1 Tax=Trichonephila inaurata madagascariensis TaxID=2747483 RepID=A0A8X6KCP3_9ARAC|nr:hypothetical protein TNIN_33951 [Trichonephila inaurata madagascariensis]